MSWNQTISSERIADHLENMGEIKVEKLVREADLDALLSETVCRRIYGAHVYATIPNFTELSSDTTLSKDGYARLIRCVHCYQREASRIVESMFGGVRVHFQGPKLHALIYRPIDDAKEIAVRAVLLQLVLRDFMNSTFNAAFPNYADFALASGSDIGEVIGTKNGQHGDRELLFVGAAANHAAKMIAIGSRLSPAEHAELPDNIKELCTATGDVYRIAASHTKLDELLSAHDLAWDREKSKERLEEDRDAVPLAEIAYSDATAKIKFEHLGLKNNKRVVAASVFADVCGFTKYIDAAQTDEERVAALRVFAALRREFAKVVKNDFNGVRVQYQGDRIQALFHLPKGDRAAIALQAVNAAVALQSSMEITLKAHLPGARDLGISVGVDLGTTLASLLGTRGQRDRICLGVPVEKAAALEDLHGKRDVAVSAAVYEELPDDIKIPFKKNGDAYIANGLTIDSLEFAQKASLYDSGAPVAVGAVLGAVGIGLGIAAVGVARAAEGERRGNSFTPSRTHGNEHTG